MLIKKKKARMNATNVIDKTMPCVLDPVIENVYILSGTNTSREYFSTFNCFNDRRALSAEKKSR